MVGCGLQFALRASYLETHSRAQFRVRIRKRFVHEKRPRFTCDCTPHRNPLPLATRQDARFLLSWAVSPRTSAVFITHSRNSGLGRFCMSKLKANLL